MHYVTSRSGFNLVAARGTSALREQPCSEALLVKRVTARQADGDGIGNQGVHANRAILLLAVSGARQLAENVSGHAASHVVLVQALQLLLNASENVE